jgi:hypothetical protein
MTGRKRGRTTAAAVLALSGLLAVGASVVSAHARSRTDTGTIYAATTHVSGGFSYASGQGSSKLFGPVAITYKIKAQPTPAGTFQLTVKPVIEYTATGSLLGTATATLTVAADGSSTITNGKLSLKHGTGSLAGHKLTGTFTGTGTSSGQYAFHYKDTFK